MSSLPPIVNLQAFEAVARRRSFALAATELHLTPSAISHQVARLESQLGARLLERSAHGVRLTAAGERYIERVSGALAAIGMATEDVKQGVSNSLYVHCSPSIATLWLMPRLPSFAEANPGIVLNLSAAPTHSDFAFGPAEIDIRYGVPNWPDLVLEPLFEERIVPMASPAFIRAHQLRHVEQLAQVPLIQSNVNVVQWTDWFAVHAHRRAPERFALRFDRAQMAMDAAILGLGVALESATLASRHLRDSKLRPLFGLDKCVRVKAHFAVYPARHAMRAPVEAFLAWIHAEAARSDDSSGQTPTSASPRRGIAS
jgi:DNA-binding transcriptional LysR family regulator